jgi:putative tryptophan/tyrosine transport system substrate-binding protein
MIFAKRNKSHLTPVCAVRGRRTFIVGTGLAWLLAASTGLAQQDQPPYRIALVEAGDPDANHHFLDAFMSGLRESGFVPDKNIVVDVRWARGQVEGFRNAFAEVIPLRPQVIVVSSTLGAVEAKKATTSIPVVFIGVPDPIGSGLVDSLARPGGNLTGLARAAGEGLMGKTVQVLTAIAPGVTRLAILWNPTAAIEERRAQAVAAARANGMTPLVVELRNHEGIEAAFTSIRSQRANGLFVVTDPLTLANRNEIVKFAASNRIPAVYEFGEFVRAGGLVAYAPSVAEQFRRSAIYVDKILRGAKPGDLPVEQPTKFELVINQKAAKALGITIPKDILLRADEVIQ